MGLSSSATQCSRFGYPSKFRRLKIHTPVGDTSHTKRGKRILTQVQPQRIPNLFKQSDNLRIEIHRQLESPTQSRTILNSPPLTHIFLRLISCSHASYTGRVSSFFQKAALSDWSFWPLASSSHPLPRTSYRSTVVVVRFIVPR
jgi:hypothetical protein